jgi:phosphopantothenoylcysteine decarboxylase/phosphopantothenate--cysteine ligase
MSTPPSDAAPRLLITSGPTHEPIDAVRFIGNRSSGRLGAALADEASSRGWPVTALVGPLAERPTSTPVETIGFTSCADLESRLVEHLPSCDVLIMAAAVADYRPAQGTTDVFDKKRRREERITIELEKTPDLLGGCVERRRPGQLLVGFALEPRHRLEASAGEKLERKRVDMIVANPLETMDSGDIEPLLMIAPALGVPSPAAPGRMTKPQFAAWLLDQIAGTRAHLHSESRAHEPKA